MIRLFCFFFFFSSRRRHTRLQGDWSSDVCSSDLTVAATFTQTKNPRHPEGYGLIIGGSRLGDTRNRYTYYLVRGDGTFLIKRRVAGDSTVQVSNGWTPSDAVAKADSAGQATNQLGGVAAGRAGTS